jgi:hypothetical protein
MRTSLLFTCFLLLGALCTAQELTGPNRIPPGTLASFEITPAQEASWHIVIPSGGTYQVDTGLSKLYFASPECGQYTVIAGIIIDGKPQLLVKTFINGEEGIEPIPIPLPPVPLPPVSSLEAWIKTQLPVLVKSKNLESRLVAECFEQIVRRIDDGNIKTPQNAQTQLQITLTGTLALASPTAVTDWMPFLTELSRQIEKELGEKVNDINTMKTVIQNVGDAMKSFELPRNASTAHSISF